MLKNLLACSVKYGEKQNLVTVIMISFIFIVFL